MTAANGIVAVVLAAGAASRFGGDKLLHPLHGKPLAAHIADTINTLNLAHCVAICPPGQQARSDLFSSRGFEIVENSDPGQGMGSSLALGAQRAMQLGSPAMLVCLADMPHITRAHLEQLLAAGRTADVIATIAEGVRTPPVLFAHKVLPKLTALAGDRGARDLIQGAATIEASTDLVRDYDTLADFAR